MTEVPAKPKPRPRLSLRRPVPAPRRLTQSNTGNDESIGNGNDHIHTSSPSPIDNSIRAINRGMPVNGVRAQPSYSHVVGEQKEDHQNHSDTLQLHSNHTQLIQLNQNTQTSVDTLLNSPVPTDQRTSTSASESGDSNNTSDICIHLLDLPVDSSLVPCTSESSPAIDPPTLDTNMSRCSDDYITLDSGRGWQCAVSPSAPPNSPSFNKKDKFLTPHHAPDIRDKEVKLNNPTASSPVKFRTAAPERPRPQLEPHLVGSQLFPQLPTRMSWCETGPPTDTRGTKCGGGGGLLSKESSPGSIHVQMADVTPDISGSPSKNHSPIEASHQATPTSVSSKREERNSVCSMGKHSPPIKRKQQPRLPRRTTVSITPDRFVPHEYSSSPIVQALADSTDERPDPPSFPNCVQDEENERSIGHQPEMHVSLLDRIARTHPIWFLKTLGRAATTHLLRTQQPGNFIVRASSRPHSMALSIRLPEGHSIDVDHYVIEIGQERGCTVVRLETSPNSFRSLPQLIEFYHTTGEELQTCLRLPPAIMQCTTSLQLQQISLMGPDFWSSPMASSAGSSSSISPPYREHARGNHGLPSYQDAQASKSSSSTASRVRTGTSVPPSPTPSSKSLHALRTPTSKRKERVPTSPALSTSSKDGHRKSFLRSLFSFGGSDHKTAPVNQLATCHYFVPHNARNMSVKSSRSAYELQRHAYDDGGKDTVWKAYRIPERVCGNGGKDSSMYSSSALHRPTAGRLAKHHEGSPGPPSLHNSPISKRTPLRPPQSAMDQAAMRSCVEELRRKRLQTADELLIPGDSRGTSSSPAVRHRTFGGSLRSTAPQQRLSVPNLVDQQVIHSAKAIKEKIGRADDGQLLAINEGLVTPVVRRKQFSSVDTVHSSEASYERNTDSASGSEKGCETSEIIRRGREAVEAVLQKNHDPFSRRFHSERSRPLSRPSVTRLGGNPQAEDSGAGGDWSGSIGRREGSGIGSGPSSGTSTSLTPQPTTGSWGAVTGELKSRQRIAKVRPSPQLRMLSSVTMRESTSSVASSSHRQGVPPTAKIGDYAQLADLSVHEMANGSGMCSRDDDTLSVAGTVFNEPWDSNVWDNLLDLAHHGDEPPSRINDTITEEEDGSDSEGTAGSRMHDSEDEEPCVWRSPSIHRAIPSDLVTEKAWVGDAHNDSVGTVDSNERISMAGTLKKGRTSSGGSPQHSLLSLPRAVSRLSDWQMGSVDDLPTQMPSLTRIHEKTERRKDRDEHATTTIQRYVERLAEDGSMVFGATLRRFVECTVESEECDPNVVVRNVRQFLNGIKNYLVKNGEGDLHKMIESETSRLNANQILNIDAILEAVLHKVLLRPIKPHLYHLMVKENSRTGALHSLSANLILARTLSFTQLGFANPELMKTPTSQQLEAVKLCMRKMQHHYSPIKKLENLLRAISVVIPSCSAPDENSIPVTGTLKKGHAHTVPTLDELARWLVYIISRTSSVGCEVEAWYMWELLPQPMVTQGDGSYYLTALFSALHILKSEQAIRTLAQRNIHMISSMEAGRGSTGDGCGQDCFVRVAIPDEINGSISYCTFPGVPQMTVSKLCRVIAHQQAITNPEDYGLYLLVDGYETCLMCSECPDRVRERLMGKPHLFVYKRHEAKIAWPKQVVQSAQSFSQLAV